MAQRGVNGKSEIDIRISRLSPGFDRQGYSAKKPPVAGNKSDSSPIYSGTL